MYLCKAAFSPYALIKTTYQNRLNAETDEYPSVFY